ncbi:hypothetical protein [Amycolatopsis methanolica]|uniref:Uncharacterized protein n=1 Tax=Amycolatopsis methanolica 239 TaxID=1068978 RepID=A0A076MX68_AMYME|nr:hypothetical protein [Amycolatopsis methanolica]AIJ25524.1 hypothetical protein AMETH_5432 [Amycolatopsis methanolica 239]
MAGVVVVLLASIAATAMTGRPATVLVAIGLVVLAPELVVLVNRVLKVLSPRGAAGHLAAVNLSAAPVRVRPAVTLRTGTRPRAAPRRSWRRATTWWWS